LSDTIVAFSHCLSFCIILDYILSKHLLLSTFSRKSAAHDEEVNKLYEEMDRQISAEKQRVISAVQLYKFNIMNYFVVLYSTQHFHFNMCGIFWGLHNTVKLKPYDTKFKKMLIIIIIIITIESVMYQTAQIHDLPRNIRQRNCKSIDKKLLLIKKLSLYLIWYQNILIVISIWIINSFVLLINV